MNRLEELHYACVQSGLDNMQKSAGLIDDMFYAGEAARHLTPTRRALGRANAVLNGPLNPITMYRHKGVMDLARKIDQAEAVGLRNTAIAGAAGLGSGALIANLTAHHHNR